MKRTGDNLEDDLKKSPLIKNKAITSESYAQHIYAALCNNEFLKINLEDTPEDLVKVLGNDFNYWSCSWRYSGGIVADLVEYGDYINWYCSGMRDLHYTGPLWYDTYVSPHCVDYVPEGCITNEVRADLRSIGWQPVAGGDWEKFTGS